MQRENSKQSSGSSCASFDHQPASCMKPNDITIEMGSTDTNVTHESKRLGEITSDETPAIFTNKPIRRGKWTPEEERYAQAIIEAFEEGTLQGVENGCTLRSYLSEKLHCAPMRISKKFVGKSIGKQVFLSKVSETYGPRGTNYIQETMNKIRRLEQQFNITLLEEESSISTHLELIPSTSSKGVPTANAFNTPAANTSHVNPLPSLLLQPPYINSKPDEKLNQMKPFDSTLPKSTGQNRLTEKPTSDAIADLFEAYQQARIYHGVQRQERDDIKDQNLKANESVASDSRADKDSLVTEHDDQVWWNDTASLLVSLDRASNYETKPLSIKNQAFQSRESSIPNHSNSISDSTTICSEWENVSKQISSDLSHTSSNIPTRELSKPVLISAADEYAILARQSMIEASKHSAYCKTSSESKMIQDGCEPMTIPHTTSGKETPNGITHAVSMNRDLELYSKMLDDFQKSDTRLKSEHSDLGPNTVSGSDRSSDNCTNTYDGSSGSGSQNGISTGTSDIDNSDTGSDEASLGKKKHKLDVTFFHHSRPLQKRLKEE